MNDFVKDTADALENRDFEKLEQMRREIWGTLQDKDSEETQNSLIDSMIGVLEELGYAD